MSDDKDESLWDAMERLRLFTLHGIDQLQAGAEQLKQAQNTEGEADEQ